MLARVFAFNKEIIPIQQALLLNLQKLKDRISFLEEKVSILEKELSDMDEDIRDIEDRTDRKRGKECRRNEKKVPLKQTYST